MSKRTIYYLLLLFMVALVIPSPVNAAVAGSGEKDCRDHPFFSRLKGYIPVKCIHKDSASFVFPVDPAWMPGFGDRHLMTGRFSSYHYRYGEKNSHLPSLLIFKALEDSIRYAYGRTAARKIALGDTTSFISARIVRDNFQTWIYIKATGPDYHLTFIDRSNRVRYMSAAQMYDQLEKNDTVTLDIFFDDDTSTVIPASMPVVEQLYLMLKEHPGLKVSIQSHSDSYGYPTSNKMITANRAKEVLDMMTARGIDKKRLTSCGWGGDHPVADNATEEGRALNRRIVIVKK